MMDDFAQSPRRRHILSSINPEPERKRTRRRSASPAHPPSTTENDDTEPRKEGETETAGGDRDDAEDKTRPRRSRLKLKDHKSSRRRSSRSRERRRHERSSRRSDHDRERDRDRDRDRDRERDDRPRHRHRRHKHRHRSPTPPNPYEEDPLDPQAAFRESLFDAMADDEGADYWANVYGQPVHIYSNERVGPQGELERMTDEEYAAHVRQKMWEKTHAGLLEERARREEAKKNKEAEERRQRKLQREVEESLRKGEERRQRRMWVKRWEEYANAWSTWDGSVSGLSWPVESGNRHDIDEKSVRLFLIQGLGLEDTGEKEFVARLREERVRWHPDKIQQRLGGDVDEETMKDVTAIFQIIDRLWSEMRKG